jgi:ribonuclease HI
MASIVIYTDGAAQGNPGKGGYGTVLLAPALGLRKELAEGFRLTTNNRMELLAVIVGLEALKREGMQVKVYSDSKYVVDAVEKKWVLDWEKRNFLDKGTERPNADLWRRFLQVYRKHQVAFQWIRGHAGIPENERCDALAVAASNRNTLKIDTYYEEHQHNR